MLFYFLKVYHNIFCLSLLLFVSLLTTNQSSSSLKGENANAKSIVDDLVAGMRGVFAVGRFRSKLTLFISGTGSITDPNGGYQVTVDKVVNSVITISQDPEPLPSGIDWLEHSIKFVCSDSTGTYLVTMNKTNAGALSLDKKNFIDLTGVEEHNTLGSCFEWGVLHMSTLNPLQFYIIYDYGEADVYYFLIGENPSPETTLSSATHCLFIGDYSPKFLCVNGDQVVYSKKLCDFSFFTDIISGFVDEHTAYFFAKNNTVYTFSAKVFQENGPSAKLIKAGRADAWKGPKGDDPRPSKPTDETTSSQASQTNQSNFSQVIIVSTGFLVLLVIGVSVVVYCCFCNGGDEKKKDDNAKVDKKATKKRTSKNKKKVITSAGSPSKKKKKGKKSSKKGRNSQSRSRCNKSSHRSFSKQNKITSSRRSSAVSSH